jgi:hypothetical protein
LKIAGGQSSATGPSSAAGQGALSQES